VPFAYHSFCSPLMSKSEPASVCAMGRQKRTSSLVAEIKLTSWELSLVGFDFEADQ